MFDKLEGLSCRIIIQSFPNSDRSTFCMIFNDLMLSECYGSLFMPWNNNKKVIVAFTSHFWPPHINRDYAHREFNLTIQTCFSQCSELRNSLELRDINVKFQEKKVCEMLTRNYMFITFNCKMLIRNSSHNCMIKSCSYPFISYRLYLTIWILNFKI